MSRLQRSCVTDFRIRRRQQSKHEKDLKVYHDFMTNSNHRTAESIDEPITKANLTLEHDGNVYTHPKCMKGVPIEKIHPNHPNWHLGWEDIAPWIEQLPHVRRNMPSQVLDEEFRKRTTILEFLEGAEFCPYQLVAKKYIKSSLTRIDVIFRLAETMLALKSFKLDNVTPLEWFRQRLHEIINDEGSRFSLTMTILNFRHDPKYVKLRDLNGERTMDPSQTNDPNHDGLTTGLYWELKRIKCLVDTVGGGAYKTQYWQWIAGDNWQGFRHWGLADRNGCPTWTIYDEPVNFHLKLEHIKKIRWATNTFKVEIVCEEGVMISDKPRGNLLAEFKRESTKHRFLYFCHHHSIFSEKTDDDKYACYIYRYMSVTLTNHYIHDIETAWVELKSRTVPEPDPRRVGIRAAQGTAELSSIVFSGYGLFPDSTIDTSNYCCEKGPIQH